jgi:hypothetical protein
MNPGKKIPLAVWWVVWAVFSFSVLVYYGFLGRNQPGARPTDAGWPMAFAPVLVAAVLRWTVLPRITDPNAALSVFVAGIAFGESACFMGLFLFPAHRLALVILSEAAVFQFIPVFANRFYR